MTFHLFIKKQKTFLIYTQTSLVIIKSMTTDVGEESHLSNPFKSKSSNLCSISFMSIVIPLGAQCLLPLFSILPKKKKLLENLT